MAEATTKHRRIHHLVVEGRRSMTYSKKTPGSRPENRSPMLAVWPPSTYLRVTRLTVNIPSHLASRISRTIDVLRFGSQYQSHFIVYDRQPQRPHHNQETETQKMAAVGTLCSSPGCGKPVMSNLACPKCIELGLAPTYFCTQACFKTNYAVHKQVHTLAKQIIEAKGYVFQLICC